MYTACIIDEGRVIYRPGRPNVMTNSKQLGLPWPPGSTWNHEADHEAHRAGEEDDPDDSLHNVPAILRDVLEAVQGGLRTVTLALLSQPRHFHLEEIIIIILFIPTHYIQALVILIIVNI